MKLVKMVGGIQVMASFVDPKLLKNKNDGFSRCKSIINKIKKYEKDSGISIVIENKEELINAVNNKETKVILSIENGSAISGNLENVEYFYNQGVRIMSITWNNENDLGCGCKCKQDTGLTKLGIDYVKKLNSMNIAIDVSHLSVKSFWDVIKISNNPIVATHSNVFEICNHCRNLKNEQIKAIAKCGGIIGICYYKNFLNSNKIADVKDIVKHIKYIKNLVGIDYVGLGSDFDGMDYNEIAVGVENIGKIGNIVKEMENEKFSSEDIEKVMWKNWNNVLKRII